MKQKIKSKGIIAIKPYAAGVCFDKKDKQKVNGMTPKYSKFFLLIASIKE